MARQAGAVPLGQAPELMQGLLVETCVWPPALAGRPASVSPAGLQPPGAAACGDGELSS